MINGNFIRNTNWSAPKYSNETEAAAGVDGDSANRPTTNRANTVSRDDTDDLTLETALVAAISRRKRSAWGPDGRSPVSAWAASSAPSRRPAASRAGTDNGDGVGPNTEAPTIAQSPCIVSCRSHVKSAGPTTWHRPSENAALVLVAREVGVGAGTLARWREMRRSGAVDEVGATTSSAARAPIVGVETMHLVQQGQLGDLNDRLSSAAGQRLFVAF